MNRAFVFSATAFLLIIPAAILAGSFLQIVKSGDDATILIAKSDVTFYAYKNIKSSFNTASCSYFLLSGSDTSAIIGNLTDDWAPYIESNFTGLNISIAKSQINVTYNAAENSIRVGNINDINDGISINITYQNTTIEGEIGPLEIKSNCDVLTSGVTGGDVTAQITLFLRLSNTMSYTEGTSDANSTFVNIPEGSSVTWTIDPLNATHDFNITGDIDIYLYLDPNPDGGKYPDLTVTLNCGLCSPSELASLTEDQITNDTAEWHVITISPSAGTIIPVNSNLSLTLSVPTGPQAPSIDVYYDSSTYNSGVNIPGSTSEVDTEAPSFGGLTSATDAGTGGQINLLWSAASDPSTPITYYIYISNSDTFDYNNENYTTTNTYYNVTGLTNGQWYNFVVRAQDSASNMDDNTVNKSATPSGTSFSETLYSSGNYTGSSDTFDDTKLLNDDNKKVVVDQGDIELADFYDPTGTVTDITSCVIYWIDKAKTKGGASASDANRTIDAGDGSAWTWGTYGPTLATSGEAQYSLDITSYFEGVSVDEAGDINNIRLRYTSNDTTGNVDFEWDQVYIVIQYT